MSLFLNGSFLYNSIIAGDLEFIIEGERVPGAVVLERRGNYGDDGIPQWVACSKYFGAYLEFKRRLAAHSNFERRVFLFGPHRF